MALLLAAGALSGFYFPLALIGLAPMLGFVVWFFRDPERRSDAAPAALISPADGKVVEISQAQAPDHVDGASAKIAVFMNVFNVHVNRAPTPCVVEWTRATPGRFMNAIRDEAAVENERVLVALRDEADRPVLLNLVAGLIARRIVCPLKPGDTLARGQRLGMIRFGSRVEVYVPAERFKVAVRLGQAVRAGETVLGEWT